MAFDAWMAEDFGDSRFDLGRAVYEYMVRYYYRSAHFSRVMVSKDAQQDILSFLLAYAPKNCSDSEQWFQERIARLSVADAIVARDYHRYLGEQSKRIAELAKEENYLIAGLFVSRRDGCGSPLMRCLLEQAKDEAYESLYLWADANCNCEYYRRHGFEQVARFDQTPFLEAQKLDILVFKKTL